MNAEQIRKLADMLTNLNDSDAPWYEEHKYAPVLRACADVVEALEWYGSNGKQLFYCEDGSKLRADFSHKANEALAKLEAIKP